MKTKTAVVVITAMVLSFGTLFAEDAPPFVIKVDRRLLKTDLNILFEQYKKVSTLLADLELQAGLSEAQGKKRTEQEQEALDRQRVFLRQQTEELTGRIKRTAQQAAQMQRPKEANKSEKKHAS